MPEGAEDCAIPVSDPLSGELPVGTGDVIATELAPTSNELPEGAEDGTTLDSDPLPGVIVGANVGTVLESAPLSRGAVVGTGG